MPLEGHAPVGEDAHLFYVDSGAVSNEGSYSTVVILHGTVFNGYTFHKLLPLAAASKIRLVLVNRRGYRNSSPYTEKELALLKAGNVEYLQDRASELARFLLWMVKEQQVPKVMFASDNRTEGGIFLVGWSAGNALTLSLFGQELPAGLGAELRPYLRKLVVYDPPFALQGYDLPAGIAAAKIFPDLGSSEDSVQDLGRFIGTHHDHPDLASRSVTGLDVDGSGTNSTLDRMKDEELSTMLDPEQLFLTELPLSVCLKEGLRLSSSRALF